MGEVLERGAIQFSFRPHVGAEEVDRLRGVQRFFVVLEPAGARHYRRLVLAGTRLPDPRLHERAWAFVAGVTRDPQDPGTRPAGRGRYALVAHGGRTDLAYVLEWPPRLGATQQALNLRRRGGCVVAVRNPQAPAPPGAGLPRRRRSNYPAELRALFGTRRFIPADPPRLLDYPGTELVLIGANLPRGLGIELFAEAGERA